MLTVRKQVHFLQELHNTTQCSNMEVLGASMLVSLDLNYECCGATQNVTKTVCPYC